ncbi:hypothetical protein [Salinibacterium sp. GXW1014]|uniref:hypothetical protein n=1 Tax=Salinibacterium sp. GXW1014 TaxID=3377838 RepID=UPI00383B7AE0
MESAVMQRLVATMTFVFLAFAAVPSEPMTVVLAITTTLVLGYVARRLASRPSAEATVPGIGRRARAHRQALDRSPEPQHPTTDGRPRSRAPGALLSA